MLLPRPRRRAFPARPYSIGGSVTAPLQPTERGGEPWTKSILFSDGSLAATASSNSSQLLLLQKLRGRLPIALVREHLRTARAVLEGKKLGYNFVLHFDLLTKSFLQDEDVSIGGSFPVIVKKKVNIFEDFRDGNVNYVGEERLKPLVERTVESAESVDKQLTDFLRGVVGEMGGELLSRVLEVDPAKRWTAREALERSDFLRYGAPSLDYFD